MPWLYGWPLLDIIVYGALLSLAVEVQQGVVRFPKTPAFLLAVGLWFSTLMSHIAHGYFKGMMDTLPETFKICFFLALILVVVDRIGRLRAVINILVLAGVIMAVDALVQYNTGTGFTGSKPLVYY
ncbi:MAG: hypothetical protein WCO77_07075, partial [bacterium]